MITGRPRRNGAREPNGRIQRIAGETERQARETAVSARIRVHGVEPTAALDQRAGSLIGRMRLAGDITEEQYLAAVYWQQARSRLEWAIDVPGRVVEPKDGTTSGGDPDRTAEAVQAAIATWDEMHQFIRSTPFLSNLAKQDMIDALEAYIVREHLIGTLFLPLKRALDRVDEFVTRAAKRG